MSFRRATMDDVAILYRWRLEAEQQNPQPNRRPVTPDRHWDWVFDRVHDSMVDLLIWEPDGSPDGMARFDSNGEFAFHAAPGRNAAHLLRDALGWAAQNGRDRIKVTVDADDEQTWAQLVEAGFVEFPAKAFVYRR